MNHYETLGLDKSASPDDIKSAYRALSSKHHPDKGGDAETMARINRAYETLSDPEKRARYDAGAPEKGQTVEEAAMAIFLTALDAALDQTEPILSFIKEGIGEIRKSADRERTKLVELLEVLRKRQGKLKLKNPDDEDLINIAIATKIAKTEKAIGHFDSGEKVLDGVIALCDRYNSGEVFVPKIEKKSTSLEELMQQAGFTRGFY